MIRRMNDYSFLNDEAFTKIAKAVNDQTKLVKITDNESEAIILAKQLQTQGYCTKIESKSNEFYVTASPREKVLKKDAEQSGQFKKIAKDCYAFSKKANNPLGLQHYNFDEGTIWKIMAGKDGKEYLVKEIDDTNQKIIRQPSQQGFKSTVLASNQVDSKKLVKLCNILYNNPSNELVNDMIRYATKSVVTIINEKINNIIDSELQALCITSPRYKNEVKEKIAFAIDNNAIFNRQQISDLIANVNKK